MNPYAEVYLEFGDEGKRLTVHAPSVNQVYPFLKDLTAPWTPSKEDLNSFQGNITVRTWITSGHSS